jgi:uncharacterized integral membrane protein (TIGR00698 family)
MSSLEKVSQKFQTLGPGVVLSAATATAGFQLASALTTSLGVPISGIPMAILLGMTVKNTVGYSNLHFEKGIQFATKTILQGGIVAVAAKLSFVELVTTGTQGIPVVVASVGAGLLFIPLAGQWAGLNREMALLLTAGTSICGVTAITALAPAIQASHRDVAVAVANTVAFGTVGMLLYPYVFHTLCTSSEQVGMCLGVAIHDTSQVLGSAMSYKETFGDEVALKVAAVTKLTRNLGLAVALPGLTYLHSMERQREASTMATPIPAASTSAPSEVESTATTSTTTTTATSLLKEQTLSGLVSFQKYVPPFLVAFLAMSSLRSVGDFALVSSVVASEEAVGGLLVASGSSSSSSMAQAVFQDSMNFIGNDVSKYALGTAMAGVGLSTSASSLKGVGWKPFAVGAAGALVVGGTGFTVSCFVV